MQGMRKANDVVGSFLQLWKFTFSQCILMPSPLVKLEMQRKDLKLPPNFTRAVLMVLLTAHRSRIYGSECPCAVNSYRSRSS